jgi:hypothetical protein
VKPEVTFFYLRNGRSRFEIQTLIAKFFDITELDNPISNAAQQITATDGQYTSKHLALVLAAQVRRLSVRVAVCRIMASLWSLVAAIPQSRNSHPNFEMRLCNFRCKITSGFTSNIPNFLAITTIFSYANILR